MPKITGDSIKSLIIQLLVKSSLDIFVCMKKRILVFPCGSEIGLEIHRSVRYSTHFELIGGSSVSDHGRFVYEEYVGEVPLHTDLNFEAYIIKLVGVLKIDAIYPTMDAVSETLQNIGAKHGIKIIGSSPEATSICAAKSATYKLLENIIPIPRVFDAHNESIPFPVFVKPDRGYGSRNSYKVDDKNHLNRLLNHQGSERIMILEYLPGMEWTIDCFSNQHGSLLYHGVRRRSRVSNGISVHTVPDPIFADVFSDYASKINFRIKPRGAWFFQMKNDVDGHPKLLEVATRLGGSSSLFRAKGINFALLSLFDSFGYDVSIHENFYEIEMDRALDNKYIINLHYKTVYVDLDDCLIVNENVNIGLLSFLYECLGKGKSLELITRHHQDPLTTLNKYRIGNIFNAVHHLTSGQSKADFISDIESIFIDDSNTERKDVAVKMGIPVFSPDMVEALTKNK